MPSIYEKRDCISEFLSRKFIFCFFFVITAQLMRFDFPLTSRINREKTCLNANTELWVWICFLKYCYNSEMLVTAFLFGQSSWIQNVYFLVENCYHRLPELSSTQERRLNQPSLQSRPKVELNQVWFGTWVERRLDRAVLATAEHHSKMADRKNV